jgi:hypothetical protein
VKITLSIKVTRSMGTAKRETFPGPWLRVFKCADCGHVAGESYQEMGAACRACGAVDTRIVDDVATKRKAADEPRSLLMPFTYTPPVFKEGVGRPLWVQTVARKVADRRWWKPATWRNWRWEERSEDSKPVDPLDDLIASTASRKT